MKLLQKIFLAVVSIFLLFVLLKKYQPSLHAMYPQQCTFIMNDTLSESFKQTLQKHIYSSYQDSQKVQPIFDEIVQRYGAIKSMDAYICNADQMCFTFDVAKPLFLLNNVLVCDNLQTMDANYFKPDVIGALNSISSTLPNSDLAQIQQLVQHMPTCLFTMFDVAWHGPDEIILSDKQTKKNALLFSMEVAPTPERIELFKQLAALVPDKKKQKEHRYDFRFKDQIVIK